MIVGYISVRVLQKKGRYFMEPVRRSTMRRMPTDPSLVLPDFTFNSKLVRNGEIMYIRRRPVGHIGAIVADVDEKKSLNTIREVLMSYYLRPINIMTVLDEDYEQLESVAKREYSYDSLMESLIAVIYAGGRRFRIEPVDIDMTMYVSIVKIDGTKISDDDESDTPGGACVYITTFDKHDRICCTWEIMLDIGRKAIYVHHILISPYFIAKNEGAVERWQKGMKMSDNMLPSYIRLIVHKGCEEYIKHAVTDLAEMPVPVYSPFELWVYRRILNSSSTKEMMLTVVEYTSVWYEAVHTLDDRGLDDVHKLIKAVRSSDNDGYPYVKFSKREWKFIRKYITETTKYITDTDDVEMVRFNLMDCLSNSRYGTVMKFDYQCDDSDESWPVMFTWSVDKASDSCRITAMSMKEVKGWTPYIQADYRNVSSVHLYNDAGSLHCKLYVDNFNMIPEQLQDICDNVPTFFIDRMNCMNVILNIISILVVIHDRPQRTRMVREERLVDDNQKPSGKKNSRQKVTTTDTVVSRVLLPAKEVDEYVSTRIAADRQSSGEHRERNYVVESWPRRAHYRHLKNGKDLYIKEQTVHRSAILTNKDVVVKL